MSKSDNGKREWVVKEKRKDENGGAGMDSAELRHCREEEEGRGGCEEVKRRRGDEEKRRRGNGKRYFRKGWGDRGMKE